MINKLYEKGLIRWEPGEGDSPVVTRSQLRALFDSVVRERVATHLHESGERPCSHRGPLDMRPLQARAAVAPASQMLAAHVPSAAALVGNGCTTVRQRDCVLTSWTHAVTN